MAHMLSLNEPTPKQIMQSLAQRARQKRLDLNLTQAGLASRAGVSLGSLKRFEHSGQISLESLAKIALILGEANSFDKLLNTALVLPASLDELIAQPAARLRGRAQ
jgi:transcriptional regulator with XRE-family HTH domain